MKLEYVHISGYKNLVDTKLAFEASEMPITIIGNNGTGKSNLIEALLQVFVGVYYNNVPDFGFDIRYQAHNKSVSIQHYRESNNYTVTVDGDSWSVSRFNKRIRNAGQMPPFPAHVFTYYSGTCDRVGSIIKRYSRSYLKKLRSQSSDLERQFVFSNISQAKWILLGLVAHRHNELLHELGIGHLNNIRLSLQPPESYVSDRDDPTYWGTQGAIREFIADIDNCAQDRLQPYAGSVFPHRDRRIYTLATKDLEKIGLALEKRGANFYSLLHALAALGILVENEFDIARKDSEDNYKTEYLSEGEKQLLCVIGGLTMTQNAEMLVLLDEPDTHLNPTWSWRYKSLLERALTTQQHTTSSTIIATHDPIMISGLTRDQVFIARKEGGQLIYENPCRDPRGQGVANILVSEYFGLPSSLDENTQRLLDERLRLAYKQERLTEDESTKLKEINKQLEVLGLSISFRDPAYKEFEEQRFGGQEGRV